MNESNLAMKLEEYNSREDLSDLSEEELFDLAYRSGRISMERYVKIRRAIAALHGQTLEEELDEFERLTGCTAMVNDLRLLLGIEVKGDHTPADHIRMILGLR